MSVCSSTTLHSTSSDLVHPLSKHEKPFSLYQNLGVTLSVRTVIPKAVMTIKLNKHSDEALAQQQSKRLKSGSLYGAHGYSDEVSTPDKGEVKSI